MLSRDEDVMQVSRYTGSILSVTSVTSVKNSMYENLMSCIIFKPLAHVCMLLESS